MARPLRIEYEGAFYHVTSRGNERRKIFFGKADYEKFKSYLTEAKEKYGYRLHCYVLMTNHYHLLIETPKGNMSKVMHYINGSYTNYVNRRRGRSGHLFQGRYKAIVVARDSYLLEVSRYLHLNPVRAKIVEKPEDYHYSSYRSYISGKKEDLVTRDLILGMVSRNPKHGPRSYRDFVEKVIGERPESPFKEVYGGMVLGGQHFVKEVLGRLKGEILQREEVSSRRALQGSWRSEKIIDAVCSCFRISRDKVLQDRKDYRNVAIYLMKVQTGMTNRDIGNLFGAMSYSAVAKAYTRFTTRLSEDRTLRRKVGQVSAVLSNFKG